MPLPLARLPNALLPPVALLLLLLLVLVWCRPRMLAERERLMRRAMRQW